MQKYKTREQIRLKEYDYSENGYYFITICSKDKENIFIENSVGAGLVSALNQKNQKTIIPGNTSPSQNNNGLTIIGQIIDQQWNDIPNQYDQVRLDQYIIMSNHIHGILIIRNDIGFSKRAETSPAPTLSDIVCSFKSKCSMSYLGYLKQNGIYKSAKIWQRSF